MRILIDTNIIIHLEDHKVISGSFAEFYQLAISNNCHVFYHPACINDIHRDTNEQRREITLSKLRKYESLPHPAELTDEFKNRVGQTTPNDEIDNIQLFQVAKGYVDILVTEDTGIYKKARSIGVKAKVLSIGEALQLLQNTFVEYTPSHPVLKSCSVREIESFLTTSFFDSLREKYIGFDKWFTDKCVQYDRHCYALVIEEELHAILVYNVEETDAHQIEGVYGKTLKMCTFKVDETAQGYKMGQLFLNKMFEYCIKNDIYYLYLTVYPDQPELISLLSEFGFNPAKRAGKHDDEITMLRSMNKSTITKPYNTPVSHPFYIDAPEYNKFIIPIRPEFYKTLFKDGAFRAATLFDNTYTSLNEIEGNSIRKAYICKAKRNAMKPGDILFFYSSNAQKAIEPIGILDDVKYLSDIEEIMETVSNITVYKQTDIENMLDGRGKITILLFRLASYLDKPIEIAEIRELECFSNKFQTITQVRANDYGKLKEKEYFDECYIINQT